MKMNFFMALYNMFQMYFSGEDVNNARPVQGCNSPFACIKQYCSVVQSHKVSFFDVAKILNFPHIYMF